MILHKGCIQRRLSQYLADGRIINDRVSTNSCASACPMCDGSAKDNFRPVSKKGLTLWFRYAGAFPCDATYDLLMHSIWNQPEWMKAVFDVQQGTAQKKHVEALFLQLIASQMIELKWINNIMTWVMGRSPDPEDSRETVLNHELDNSWAYWNLTR